MRKWLAMFLGTGFVLVNAAMALELPEKAGDYADLENPGVRVRVFVHEPKKESVQSAVIMCTDDPDSNAVVAKTGWKLSSNVTYRLNVGSTPLNLIEIAANSFAAWASPSGVVFSRGVNTTVNRNKLDGQNIVAWGRTNGSALAVTYTRYYASTGEVADVDTIMNQKFAWSWNSCSTNSYDAQDILTHELGHWVGLGDHYTGEYVNNTMYGYGARGETLKNTLTTGDVAGVKLVYN